LNQDFLFSLLRIKIYILIGFADRQYHRDEGPQENWRFLGLMSFSDPIQENAVTAIEKCRLAGVKVNHLSDKICNKDEIFFPRLFLSLVITLLLFVHLLNV
jgi:hypothetical protein